MQIVLTLTSHTIETGQPYPLALVKFNDIVLFNGLVEHDIEVTYESLSDGQLTITHYGKEPHDTIVVDGEIIADKALEIVALKLDDIYVAVPYLYQQEFHTNWPGADPIVHTLYLGYNGVWKIDLPNDSSKFYYHILWENERKLNKEEQQSDVDTDGNIVETFTRFGMVTEIDNNKIPTIDELYELITAD